MPLDAEHVGEILRAAGLTLADPTTWPGQSRLAADGDWEGLKRPQECGRSGVKERQKGPLTKLYARSIVFIVTFFRRVMAVCP